MTRPTEYLTPTASLKTPHSVVYGINRNRPAGWCVREARAWDGAPEGGGALCAAF